MHSTRVMCIAALCALALASSALAGCTAETTPSETVSAPRPEPTHAIVFVSESWIPTRGIEPYDASDWRISAIDLASGEERILVKETTNSVAPPIVPMLSPDGTELLYGVVQTRSDQSPTQTLGESRNMELHRLNLATGEDSIACPQPVRSFGWDGDDIIATTWRAWTVATSGASTTYMSPSHNGVLRVSGSEVTTIVPEGDRVADEDRASETALTDQLDFLGSDSGDLYFAERWPDGMISGGFGEPPLHIWRLRSGETSIAIATTLESGMSGRTDQDASDPYERLLNTGTDLPYAQFLSNGLFPTKRWYVIPQQFSTGGWTSIETSNGVLVHDATTMEVIHSIELTPTDAPLPWYDPVFDAGMTRWLDQRRLAPPDVAEEGMWLCETDVASLETTALADLSLGVQPVMPLGYIGRDMNVLYSSEEPMTVAAPTPRIVYLWERTTGESRTLIEYAGEHAGAYVRIDYVGGVVFEVTP